MSTPPINCSPVNFDNKLNEYFNRWDQLPLSVQEKVVSTVENCIWEGDIKKLEQTELKEFAGRLTGLVTRLSKKKKDESNPFFNRLLVAIYNIESIAKYPFDNLAKNLRRVGVVNATGALELVPRDKLESIISFSSSELNFQEFCQKYDVSAEAIDNSIVYLSSGGKTTSGINCDNALDILTVASHYEIIDLGKKTFPFLRETFLDLKDLSSFQKLSRSITEKDIRLKCFFSDVVEGRLLNLFWSRNSRIKSKESDEQFVLSFLKMHKDRYHFKIVYLHLFNSIQENGAAKASEDKLRNIESELIKLFGAEALKEEPVLYILDDVLSDVYRERIKKLNETKFPGGIIYDYHSEMCSMWDKHIQPLIEEGISYTFPQFGGTYIDNCNKAIEHSELDRPSETVIRSWLKFKERISWNVHKSLCVHLIPRGLEKCISSCDPRNAYYVNVVKIHPFLKHLDYGPHEESLWFMFRGRNEIILDYKGNPRPDDCETAICDFLRHLNKGISFKVKVFIPPRWEEDFHRVVSRKDDSCMQPLKALNNLKLQFENSFFS